MLEPGDYVGRAKVHGTAIADETKFTVAATGMKDPVAVSLASYRPGMVVARITDAESAQDPVQGRVRR